jgi:hypothetical protein
MWEVGMQWEYLCSWFAKQELILNMKVFFLFDTDMKYDNRVMKKYPT